MSNLIPTFNRRESGIWSHPCGFPLMVCHLSLLSVVTRKLLKFSLSREGGNFSCFDFDYLTQSCHVGSESALGTAQCVVAHAMPMPSSVLPLARLEASLSRIARLHVMCDVSTFDIAEVFLQY